MLDDPMIFPNVKFIVQHKCVCLNSTNQSINQSINQNLKLRISILSSNIKQFIYIRQFMHNG